jgi:hypothetical protein
VVFPAHADHTRARYLIHFIESPVILLDLRLEKPLRCLIIGGLRLGNSFSGFPGQIRTGAEATLLADRVAATRCEPGV